MKKQEASITDETGTMRMVVILENYIEKIPSGGTFMLEKAVIKTYHDENYVTINRQTTVHEGTHPSLYGYHTFHHMISDISLFKY